MVPLFNVAFRYRTMVLTAVACFFFGLDLNLQTWLTAKLMSERVLLDRYRSMPHNALYDHASAIGSPSKSAPSATDAVGSQLGLQSSIMVVFRIFFISPLWVISMEPSV